MAWIVCLLLSASTALPPVLIFRHISMGTIFEVQLADAPLHYSVAMMPKLWSLLDGFHHRWHAWEPSELTKLNHALANFTPCFVIDPDLKRLIQLSGRYEWASRGYFNASIGQWIAAWGFHQSGLFGPKSLPSPKLLQQWLRWPPSALAVQWFGPVAISSNPYVQFDLGGIAKGYAVAKMATWLKDHQLSQALINAGGDVYAVGNKGTGPWRIAIQAPQGQPMPIVNLSKGETLFTSGSSARLYCDQKKCYTHIINPINAKALTRMGQTTINMLDPIAADAWATASMVYYYGK